MVKTSVNSSKNKPRDQKLSRPLLFISIALLIIAAAAILPNLLPNSSLKQVNKEEVSKDSSQILTSVDLPGEPAYQDVSDQGCKEDMPRYFERYITCSFIAQKYFKANGDLRQVLNTAAERLTAAGFTKVAGSQESPDSEDPKKPLDFKTQVSSREYEVRLGHYRDEQRFSDADAQIRSLIKNGKLPPLLEGEYYYGVLLTPQYYFCSTGNSWFNGPCPTPPSTPRK